MLVVAGWLIIRTQPTPWQVALLVAGYALLEVCLVVQSVPILAAEVLLLASLIIWGPARRAADSAPMTSFVPSTRPQALR